MQAVWKFALPVTDNIDIEMPAGAKVLAVQDQLGTLCLWAIVNPASPVETRHFRIVGTGHEHNVCLTTLEYVSTVQAMGGRLVWHVFEVRSTAKEESGE